MVEAATTEPLHNRIGFAIMLISVFGLIVLSVIRDTMTRGQRWETYITSSDDEVEHVDFASLASQCSAEPKQEEQQYTPLVW